jgi:MFS superfamily sulfate permease-like transporter
LAADVDTGYRIKKVVAVVVTLVSDVAVAVAVAVALSVLLGSVQHMEQPAKDFSFSHHKRHSQRG